MRYHSRQHFLVTDNWSYRMLQPPVLPPVALTAGKISVALTWLFCAVAPVISTSPTLQSLALWLAGFLVVSHIGELIMFNAFLKAAKAGTSDYVQAFLFGMFHTGGLQIKN
jgi:uncharacterized protein YhhL (DUF1145 family)